MGSPSRHLSSISNLVASLGRWASGCHCHASRLAAFRLNSFFFCGREGEVGGRHASGREGGASVNGGRDSAVGLCCTQG
jgi:hypothetical protein